MRGLLRAERIGAMEYTSLEHVGRVVGCLKKHFDTKHKPTMHSSGGVRSVADFWKRRMPDDGFVHPGKADVAGDFLRSL